MPDIGHFSTMTAGAAEHERSIGAMLFGQFRVEVRWTWLALLAAYSGAGVLTAAAGGHVEVLGRAGLLANAAGCVVLALLAVLIHESGHAVTAAPDSARFVTASCRLSGESPRRRFALRGRRYGRRSAGRPVSRPAARDCRSSRAGRTRRWAGSPARSRSRARSRSS